MNSNKKVIGVGGIFFKSKNPETINNWYATHLGLETSKYGTIFESRDIENPDVIRNLNWCPFKESTQYFAPSEKEFMINYIVEDIEGLVAELKAGGVTILDEIEDTEYGKFVHILDPENNKIELWEPAKEGTLE